jgi:hypothetical protein
VYGFESQGSSPPDQFEMRLDPELLLKPLSKKTVEEVCKVVRSIDGLTANRVDAYCGAMEAQVLTSFQFVTLCFVSEAQPKNAIVKPTPPKNENDCNVCAPAQPTRVP